MILQRAKLSNGLSSKEWGNYKRTRQGALAALLLYLYKYKVVHATTICFPHVHHHASTSCPLLILHVFSIRPPCFLHVPWRHTFNLHCTCAHHVYTMRNPCPLMSSPNPNSISRLFPILLDPKSFQTALDYSSLSHDFQVTCSPSIVD